MEKGSRLISIRNIATGKDKLVGYDLCLDDGIKISLPPSGRMTKLRLKPGDEFSLKTREDIFEGKPTSYSDQTRVTVIRKNKFVTSFVVTNDKINQTSAAEKSL
jgi:hypothetical protein